MKRKILVIAPSEAKLPHVSDEIKVVCDLHDVKVLSGQDVTSSVLWDVVNHEQYEIVWMATHGDVHGILLSDGYMSVEGIGPYILQASSSLCVLNICSSFLVAEVLCERTGNYVVGTVGDVEDYGTSQFGIRLARALSLEGSTYESSYQSSRPFDNDQYIFLRPQREVESEKRSLKDSHDESYYDNLRHQYENKREIADLKNSIDRFSFMNNVLLLIILILVICDVIIDIFNANIGF